MYKQSCASFFKSNFMYHAKFVLLTRSFLTKFSYAHLLRALAFNKLFFTLENVQNSMLLLCYTNMMAIVSQANNIPNQILTWSIGDCVRGQWPIMRSGRWPIKSWALHWISVLISLHGVTWRWRNTEQAFTTDCSRDVSSVDHSNESQYPLLPLNSQASAVSTLY